MTVMKCGLVLVKKSNTRKHSILTSVLLHPNICGSGLDSGRVEPFCDESFSTARREISMKLAWLIMETFPMASVVQHDEYTNGSTRFTGGLLFDSPESIMTVFAPQPLLNTDIACLSFPIMLPIQESTPRMTSKKPS